MFKEDVDISQAIKQEINKVIDQWVNDLIRDKISAPMPQQHQRGLWDRVKGTLSNLWYGGRYNQNNPYYWKNRFGDDLGAQESYDPRAFNLNEYREIKEAIDKAESLIEEAMAPEVEKLRLVKTIRAAAEELKKNLHDIFVRGCGANSVSPDGPGLEPGTEPKPEPEPELQQQVDIEEPSSSVVKKDRELKPSSTDAVNTGAGPEEVPNEPKLSEKDYLKYLPKIVNKDKTVEELSDDHQFADLILHKDFEKVVDEYKPYKEGFKRILRDLMHDAIIKKENKRVLTKIKLAIEKADELLPEDDK